MAVALVTGSAKGIGKAFVLALAEDGYDVVVHYLNSKTEAEEVAKEAQSFGVRALVMQADITKAEEAEKLVLDSYAELGSLDVLINNVGNYVHAPLSDFKLTDWHEMFDSNLHSTFYTCQTAVPLMRNDASNTGHCGRGGRGGRIINIGYAGSEKLVARPGIAAYGIAKTGVILYSKSLAKVEAKNSITVNIISPGVIENSITKPIEEIPMKRLGYLDEMVGAMRYFVSKDAAYITGVTIEVSGGWNL